MYLRETKRRNRDGSTVSYLQLAHSQRHPDTGVPSAKVIHNFGRADSVDRDALTRLVASISRFIEPEQALTPARGTEVEVRAYPGIAVVSGLSVRRTAAPDGGERVREVRFTRVWARPAGRWGGARRGSSSPPR